MKTSQGKKIEQRQAIDWGSPFDKISIFAEFLIFGPADQLLCFTRLILRASRL